MTAISLLMVRRLSQFLVCGRLQRRKVITGCDSSIGMVCISFRIRKGVYKKKHVLFGEEDFVLKIMFKNILMRLLNTICRSNSEYVHNVQIFSHNSSAIRFLSETALL